MKSNNKNNSKLPNNNPKELEDLFRAAHLAQRNFYQKISRDTQSIRSQDLKRYQSQVISSLNILMTLGNNYQRSTGKFPESNQDYKRADNYLEQSANYLNSEIKKRHNNET